MSQQATTYSILLASDRPTDLQVLQQVMEPGCHIRQAGNADETIAALRAEPAAIVLLCLSPEACDAVLSTKRDDPQLAEVPVLVVTEEMDQTRLSALLEGGVRDLILRPLRPVLLRLRLQQIIGCCTPAALILQKCKLEQQTARLLMQECDELTGIYSKRAFFSHVRDRLDAAPTEEFILGRMDLDRFKVFNDVFGVDAGDLLLSQIGEMMQKWQSSVDALVGYLGADHFAFLLPRDKADLPALLRMITTWLADYPNAFDFSPRIGFYRVLNRRIDVSLMCDRALMALRTIKGNYTQFIAAYDDSMLSALLEEQELLLELKTALTERQFVLFIQPQYNLINHTMSGAECLVRWMHPTKGMISPGKFIPICEKNGLITQLDEFVWEEACRLQRKWMDEGRDPVPVSVNISRIDLYLPHLCKFICGLVEKYRIPTSLLRLEITESAYMDNSEQLISVVRQLRENGFFIEMDDFGSGYSSLNTLKNVPVDLLKLDMKFLQDDSGDGKSGIILNSIVQMTHWLSLPVIAEGVETARQADYLKTIGCDQVQGFLFAKPMPVADFEALMAQTPQEASQSCFATASFFNSAEFWDPDAQATVIFNSFVGAAGIFEYQDGTLTTIRLNDKFFDLTEVPRNVIDKQTNVLHWIAPADEAFLIEKLEELRQSDREVSGEFRWKIPGASKYTLWTSIRARKIAVNHERFAVYAAIEDITVLKCLIEENSALNRHLSSIIESIPGGIFTMELGELVRISFMNDTLPAMFGYTREEFSVALEYNALANVLPEDLPTLRNALREAAADDSYILNVQYRHRRKDDTVVWVHLHGKLIETSDGVPSICGILQDIQAQKQLEEENAHKTRALKEALESRLAEDERNRILMERTGICVFDYDIRLDELHIQTNLRGRGIKKLTIAKYNEMLSDIGTVHPDYVDAMHELIQNASRAPITDTFDYIANNWGTGFRWSRMHYVSVADESGDVVRIVGQIDDIQAEKDQLAAIHLLAEQSENEADTAAGSLAEQVFRILYDATDLDNAIASILEVIGHAYDVSRVYVFEDSADHTTCTNTFEWCAEGVAPQKDVFQHFHYPMHDGKPRFPQVFAHNDIRCLEDTHVLPDYVNGLLQQREVKSLLQCAIRDGGIFYGFFGFEDCTRTHHWTSGQIRTLSLITKLIGEFLIKQRKGQEAAFSESFRTALDSNASYIYIVHPETYEIIYANRAFAREFGDDCLGKPCHTALFGEKGPCPHCPLALLQEDEVSNVTEMHRPDGSWLLIQAATLHWASRRMIMMTAMDISAYKENEQKLRTRNEEYRIVVAQSGKHLVRYEIDSNRLRREYDIWQLFAIPDGNAASPEELLETGCIAPESEISFTTMFEKIRQSVPTGHEDIRMRCADGRYRWFHIDYALVFVNGAASHAILSFFDNTKQYEKELAYRKWKNTLSAILHDSTVYREVNLSQNRIEREEGDPVFCLSAQCGGVLSAATQYGIDHFVALEDAIPYLNFFSVDRLLTLYAAGVYEDNLEYRMQRPGEHETPRWYRANVQMVKYPYSEDIKAFLAFLDIHETREEYDRLMHRAARDPLTGLLNRDAVRQSVTALLRSAHPSDAFALFLIDLDNFKQVNETLGLHEGDRTLRSIAAAVTDVFRSCDLIARVSNDEFLVFLPAGMSDSLVQYKAASLLHALQFQRESDITVSASIGVVCGMGQQSFDTLYQRATEALEKAKESGKNRFQLIHCED